MAVSLSFEVLDMKSVVVLPWMKRTLLIALPHGFAIAILLILYLVVLVVIFCSGRLCKCGDRRHGRLSC